jgi:hypothetical protein
MRYAANRGSVDSALKLTWAAASERIDRERTVNDARVGLTGRRGRVRVARVTGLARAEYSCRLVEYEDGSPSGDSGPSFIYGRGRVDRDLQRFGFFLHSAHAAPHSMGINAA